MLQVRQYVITVSAGLALGLSPAARAAPSLEKVLDDDLPRRLRGRTGPANSEQLLPGTAQPYARARDALTRGQPREALEALEDTSASSLLADREALAKGEAHLALGHYDQALAAFATALDKAEYLTVGLDAARGLRQTLFALGKREAELEVTDALLGVRNVDNRPELLLARAEALAALARTDEAAKQAWRLMLAYPTLPAASQAEALLDTLKATGTDVPATSSQFELARIRNLTNLGAFEDAAAALEAFENKHPKLGRTTLMQRIELLHRQRRRSEEKRLLEQLYEDGLGPDEGPKVLYRLARQAMREDDNPTAIKYFDELTERFPSSSLADNAAYMAAWLPYNDGNNLETHERMLAFSERYRRSSKRTQALWFAGWSAYVGDKPVLAEKAWRVLLDDHPGSALVPHIWYWLGRIAHRAGDEAQARSRYRTVLAEAPMSYYGFWAQKRLAELGETSTTKPPPPPTPPTSVDAMIRRLGADRPRLIDRGVALHEAGLDEDASAELRAAEATLRRVRDIEGRTMVADVLHQLGAHYLAFRLASGITREGAELDSGEPWAWRAWRQSYPDAFEDEVMAAHRAHEVEDNLVWAVMRTESNFRPWVRSPVGARGLMQLMPTTARSIGRTAKNGRRHAARYHDPVSNVWLGTWYLKKLGERYRSQIAAMVAAYNAGPTAVDEWISKLGGVPLDEFVERIPYKETRRYTRRVIETYFVYRRMKGLPLPELANVIADERPSGGVRF